VQLAGLTHSELPEAKELLKGCAGGDVEEPRAKWVWLVLSWVWERHGGDIDLFDSLDTLDSLYSDLAPPEMEPFGPHAAAYQGKGDPQQAREQVLGELRKYLAEGESKFGKA